MIMKTTLVAIVSSVLTLTVANGQASAAEPNASLVSAAIELHPPNFKMHDAVAVRVTVSNVTDRKVHLQQIGPESFQFATSIRKKKGVKAAGDERHGRVANGATAMVTLAPGEQWVAIIPLQEILLIEEAGVHNVTYTVQINARLEGDEDVDLHRRRYIGSFKFEVADRDGNEVAELVKLATGMLEDPETKDQAWRMLVAIAHPQALEGLATALHTAEDTDAKVKIVTALRRQNTPEAFQVLHDAIGSELPERVQVHIIQSLSPVSDPPLRQDAIAICEKGLLTSMSDVRLAAANWLLSQEPDRIQDQVDELRNDKDSRMRRLVNKRG